MQCISPVRIRNPVNDESDDWINVPCGKCAFCLQRRQADWCFRIEKEQRYSSSAFFITLSYEDDKVPVSENGELELSKEDLRNFWKRLRKVVEAIDKKVKVRYYAVGEYGTNTGRPHYHAIVFNLPDDCLRLIDRAWNKGFIKIGTVTPESIAYTTKYLITSDLKDYEGRIRPFSTMSLKPGIGDEYRVVAGKHHKENMLNVVVRNGYKNKLPRYYRDRIFDKDEREVLAYESELAVKHAYELNYDKLKRAGLDPDFELAVRKQALHDKLFYNSDKNRIL